ncbi:MAG: acyl-CoA dehydratase activase [Peptococcaceae bacterium]|nr:acyl-CoA dehydratase activase [Peptococcaceae bacterium]
MITAGIDMGYESVKIVLLKDGAVVGRAKGESGGAGREAAARKAWEEGLRNAGIAEGDVNRVVATGSGKYNVEFADDQITEGLSALKAIRFLCPDATAVIDAGADETLVATVKGERIGEMAVNQKCAAGLGAFLSYMARRLELTLDEMSGLGRPGADSPAVNDGCVVFAELEALSLLNQGASPEEVAAAVTEIAAVRASSVVNDITVPAWNRVALVGGLTKNTAFVNALKVHAGMDFVIPGEAEYAGAVGAALFAAEQRK